MIKLSFIIPCYNVERYIGQCLDSIYRQGMPDESFEVICINDCSTDSTFDHLKAYQSQKQNLFIINHAKNQTIGGARNSGIEKARGEFIWFVDPDDRVCNGVVPLLYEKASKDNVDILFFNHEITNEKLDTIGSDIVFEDANPIPGQLFVSHNFGGKLRNFCIAWRSLFRTAFLQENKLLHPLMRKSADVTFVWECICMAGRVGSSSIVGYSYRVNPYSISSIRKTAEIIFSEKILFAEQIILLLNKGIVTDYLVKQDMMKTLKWCASSSVDQVKSLPSIERIAFFDIILEHLKSVKVVKPYMNKKNRLLYTPLLGKRFWLWLLKSKI